MMFSNMISTQLVRQKGVLNCVQLVNYVPVATVVNLKKPPTYSDVEFPERRRLRFFDKVPQLSGQQKPLKSMKRLIDMRGPELIHNKLQYGQFGVQAITGGSVRWGHTEMIRLTLIRKLDESRMFAIWRIGQMWKPVGKKGIGQTMGGGKSNIDHYVYPVKANRIIFEIGGHCIEKEVYRFMNQIAQKLPFKARVVSKESMAREAEKEKYIEENNINPFNFKDCIRYNSLGCDKWVTPYDYRWHGKYR